MSDLREIPGAEALAHRRLSAILASSHDAVYTTSLPDGRVDSWNPAAERLFLYSAEEMLGEPLDRLVPPDRGNEHERLFARVLAGERVEQLETERVARDGSRIAVSLSITPLIDEETTEPFGVATIARDIRERKRAEAALAEARAELERNAAELRRSNTDLEQFAYVASHDLSEPLRAISGYVQLLAGRYEGRLDEDADRYIARTTAGVERMRALINDLLAYSRVGRADPPVAPVELRAVVADAEAALRPLLEDVGGTLVTGELPAVVADRVQLAQVVQNLIANALKFRAEEPPRVEVGAERGDGCWTITVADNGIGVDPRFRDRIFEVFRRLHNRREFPGTGIGLAICKRIVEAHGGRIWVEDAPGGGSAFRFTLPDREFP